VELTPRRGPQKGRTAGDGLSPAALWEIGRFGRKEMENILETKKLRRKLKAKIRIAPPGL
jgi:hypothetical protein